MTALRLCFVFALLAVPAFAQTAATRATLYTEIDTLFADTGADPITPAQLRQSLDNITASSTNLLSDTTLTVLDGFTISSAGTITLKTTGAGDLFINKNTAASTPWFDGALMTGADATNTAWQIDAYGAQARYDIRRAGGTKASPTALSTDDAIGGIAARGYDGSAYSGTTGSFLFKANGGWSASNLGTIATIAVVPSGRLTQITAATFGANSLLSLGDNATLSTWTTKGAVLNSLARTYTDNTSTGTSAATVLHSLAASTIAATNATTFTDAANLYIAGDVAAGTNVSLTNSYGLWNVGKTRMDGAVTLGSTINKLTLTAPATGSTLTIADGKTLTASNTLTLTATDGSTLAIGTGGTLGTAAYTASSAYATSAQGTKADNVGAVNGLVKSNGSASFSAASAGTDYVVPAGNVATATALATPRAIYGNNFDGSAALSQIIASTYGGTGNGFAKFSGPTTSEKTFTLPDATATILTSNAAVTVAQGGTGATTLTANNVILGNGTTAVQFVAPGSSGNVLTSNGTSWTSATPTGGTDIFDFTKLEAVATFGGSTLACNVPYRGTAVGTGTLTTYAGSDFPAAEIRTGTTSGWGYYVAFFASSGTSNTFDLDETHTWTMMFHIRTGADIGNYRLLVGAVGTAGVAVPVAGIGVRFDTDASDTNFRLVAWDASTPTLGTDNLGAVAINTVYAIKIWCTGDGTVRATVNGGTQSTLTTGFTATRVTPLFQLINSTAADRRMQVARFAFRVEGLSP